MIFGEDIELSFIAKLSFKKNSYVQLVWNAIFGIWCHIATEKKYTFAFSMSILNFFVVVVVMWSLCSVFFDQQQSKCPFSNEKKPSDGFHVIEINEI